MVLLYNDVEGERFPQLAIAHTPEKNSSKNHTQPQVKHCPFTFVGTKSSSVYKMMITDGTQVIAY